MDCSPRSLMSDDSEKVFTELGTVSGQHSITGNMNCDNNYDNGEPQPLVTEPDSSAHEQTPYGDQSYAMVPYTQPMPNLQCLQAGDGNSYAEIMALVQSEGRSQRPYQPSEESRSLHNHKERLRRSRMKCSCDALRALVPGLNDKTDKATVLEHTVAFLFHLSKCEGVKCEDYVPTYPPPMSAKLLDLYPSLMSGEYQYFEAIPSADPDYVPPEMSLNQDQVIEVHESDGKRYVTTSDGQQFMIVDSDDTLMTSFENSTQHNTQQTMDTTSTPEQRTDDQMVVDKGVEFTPKEEPMEQIGQNERPKEECRQCVDKVIDMLTDDNKENIDPNGSVGVVPRKKRAYRRRHKKVNHDLNDPNEDQCDTELKAEVKTQDSDTTGLRADGRAHRRRLRPKPN